MSIKVELNDVAARIANREATAYLVTMGPERPHVVSVTPAVGDGAIVVGAGRKTAANVADHPEVTLLWPTDASDAKHSLLVDGTATVTDAGETLTVFPTSAILHRVRPGSGAEAGPAC
jgi:hypothetical protein